MDESWGIDPCGGPVGQAFFMRTAKTLTLGAQSFCWFCHDAAQIITDDQFY